MMPDGTQGVKPPFSATLRSALDLAVAAALFAASRWPAAVAVLPVLGTLDGPLGWVLLAAAVCAAASRFVPLPRVAPKPVVLFLAGVAASVGAGLHYTGRLQASGDEPHYLLMAQSLWREGDLDLEDNLAREDWREYTPGPLRPHYGAPRADGRPFPGHSPGLPVLLAPFYAAGGRAACVALLGLLAAALASLVHAWARELGAGDAAALLAWAVAAGPPVLFYSFHVYGEVPSALAVMGALWLLRPGASAVAAAGAAALAGLLPFLHHKMMPVAAVLGLAALVRLRGRALAAFLAVAAAAAAGFLGYYQLIYGRPTPMAIYEGFSDHVAAAPLRTLAGLFLDRTFGLLPHAPAYLLALAGVLAWARWPWRATWPLAAAAAATLGPVLAWRMWWGGQCPPGRFLIPLLPVLALAAAARAEAGAHGLMRWRWGLVGAGAALALWAIARPPDLLLLNRAGRPDRLWASLAGATPADRYLPSLANPEVVEPGVAMVWAALVVLLLVLDRLALRRPAWDAAFRTLAFPVLLALAAGGLIDLVLG